MERKDVLKSPDYWTTKIQTALYRCAHEFMKATGKNRSQLAEHLGVSKGYVTQLLNGDYDHKLSKLTELSLAFGYVPVLNFVSVEEYLEEDKSTQENYQYKSIEQTLPILLTIGDAGSQLLSLKDWEEAA